MKSQQDNWPDTYPPDESEDDIWTTRDGREIKIADMDDEHLMNTIKMLERNHAVVINEYLHAPVLNGEMAQDAFENEFDRLSEDGPGCLDPRYDIMIEEADRRKLDTEKVRLERRVSIELGYFNDWGNDLKHWTK
jgi:hypothetical protein